MRIAYLVNQYPKVSHSFIRREILALERQGVSVERFAVRGWGDEFPDAADRAERERTRYLLQHGLGGVLGAALAMAATRPLHFARALGLAASLWRRSSRTLFHHLAYLAEACRLVQWTDAARVDHLHAHFGTNPAEVRVDGPKKGLRILGSMEDAARALMASFDDAQRSTAVYDKVAPTDILTKNSPTFEAFPSTGVTAANLKPAQKDLLMKLIESYTVQMADDVAADRLAKIKQAGVEKVTFAWAGETEVGKKHYYRIQGPTFLVEYDNTQNDGNHVHSVWRDFRGDFGRDLLREHLRTSLH